MKRGMVFGLVGTVVLGLGLVSAANADPHDLLSPATTPTPVATPQIPPAIISGINYMQQWWTTITPFFQCAGVQPGSQDYAQLMQCINSHLNSGTSPAPCANIYCSTPPQNMVPPPAQPSPNYNLAINNPTPITPHAVPSVIPMPTSTPGTPIN